ncbi:MAG TPA: class I adenylate-forming enzyme family protein [Chondromyces sp.]|nr:class I adenylate-forming enzyme family protein [Chondromyces sp.]
MQEWVVHKVLAKAAANHPHKPFLICNRQIVTFKRLDDRTNTLASALIKEGFARGDIVAVLAFNQLEWLYTYFAATKIGVGLLVLDPNSRDSDIIYMLDHFKVKGIISIPTYQDVDFVSFFEKHQEHIPTVEKYIFIGGSSKDGLVFEDMLSHPLDRSYLEEVKQKVTEEDTVFLLYTSNTTEGIVITNRSILETAKAQADHLAIDERDCMISGFPINHIDNITSAVHCSLFSFGSVTLIPERISEKILQAIHESKPSILHGEPSMYNRLFSDKNINNYDLSSLKLCIVAGPNILSQLYHSIKWHIPNAKIIHSYGRIETSGTCILTKSTDSIEKVQESIGMAIGDFKIKVVDCEQKELSTGEIGELAIKGKGVAKGYGRVGKELNQGVSEDDWLYTGDLVYIDHQGYVYYKGKKEEKYVQGGCDIFPVEVEYVIMSHPKVAFAAGIGIPDASHGEVGRYYVMPKQGETILEEDLLSYCYQHLADYKVPKQIVFVHQLPHTPSGKIQKSLLKQQYMANAKPCESI